MKAKVMDAGSSKLFLFLVILVAPYWVTATGEDLSGPCREWLQPCLDGTWLCTSEYTYQQYRHGLQLGCPVSNSPPPPPPGLLCREVNGTCQYTASELECTTWVPDCQFSYTCGSVQERNATSDQNNCGHFFGQTPPLPDMECLAINETCQWYNPCYYWRGFCGASYHCGDADQYYDFVFGPQPLCALPPRGWGEVLPPGECVVQEGRCEWSNCTAYLDWCRFSWHCDSQYDKDVYFAGPPPPCPAPPEGYTPPPPPGQCKFDLEGGQCTFQQPATPTPGSCPVGTHLGQNTAACLPTCQNYRGLEICLLAEGCECPEGMYYDDEHGRGCVAPEECSSACPADKVYSECGTACPLTCDNYRDPPACVAVCVSGCVCPEGQVLLQSGSCVQPSQCSVLTSELGVAAIAGISVGIVLTASVVPALLVGVVLFLYCRRQAHATTTVKVPLSNSEESKQVDDCKYSELMNEDSVSESSLEKDNGFVPPLSEKVEMKT